MIPADARLVALLPYFGPLPTTFGLTLASMRHNTIVDWIIITDQPGIDESENLKVVASTLDVLRQEFSTLLGFDAALTHPYKLCDFRPGYGELFADLIKGYRYWGYCDADVVFGDLATPITSAIDAGAAKIFQRGHLSFVRNDPYHSAIWRDALTGGGNYREILSSPQSHLFDEGGGFYALLTAAGVNVYEPGDLFDIAPRAYFLRATSAQRSAPVAYAMRNGHIYEVSRITGEILREGRYIHLQKRPYPRRLVAAPHAARWGWTAPVDGETVVFGPASLAYGAWEDVPVMIEALYSSKDGALAWAAHQAKRRVRSLASKSVCA